MRPDGFYWARVDGWSNNEWQVVHVMDGEVYVCGWDSFVCSLDETWGAQITWGPRVEPPT